MAKKEKTVKAPRTIKVKTLVKHLINASIMATLFIIGIQLGGHLERQSQEVINQKAIIRVQDIKELMTVVK